MSTARLFDNVPQSGRTEPEPRAWQRMLSGRRLDLLNPSPLDIEIEDIAHGLARVPRWNGQTKGPQIFSVAQHCVIVEAIARSLRRELSDRWRLTILLHDAPEYVIGDVITPFKAVLGASYKAVENRLLAAVHIRFGLPPQPAAELQALLKRADRLAAYLEATRLAGFAEEEAARFFGRPKTVPPGIELTPWPADAAEARFLARFRSLAPNPT